MTGQEKMLKTGIIGAAIAIICCLTPVLVILLGAAGLSAWLGWADYVLLPLLGICLVIIVVAVMRKKSRKKSREKSRGSNDAPDAEDAA
jgi:mercuric ion transport protein